VSQARIVARGAARRHSIVAADDARVVFNRETPEIFTFDTSRLTVGIPVSSVFSPVARFGRLFFFAVAPSGVPGHAWDRI
jgi:hypothetical protein